MGRAKGRGEKWPTVIDNTITVREKYNCKRHGRSLQICTLYGLSMLIINKLNS